MQIQLDQLEATTLWLAIEPRRIRSAADSLAPPLALLLRRLCGSFFFCSVVVQSRSGSQHGPAAHRSDARGCASTGRTILSDAAQLSHQVHCKQKRRRKQTQPVSGLDGHAWLASETDWRTFAFGCRCRAVRPPPPPPCRPLHSTVRQPLSEPPDCTPPPVSLKLFNSRSRSLIQRYVFSSVTALF